MNKTYLVPFLLAAVLVLLSGAAGCAMMKPPAIEEPVVPEEEIEEAAEPTTEAKFTHQEVVDAIAATLTSRQFRFTLKRTDVENAEVETQWRNEEAFEGGGPGGGPGGYGSEDKYRSYVEVSFDFDKNRVNIRRHAQFLDFYINDWRDIGPRRYHREEDMEIQKVIMERLEEGESQ